MGDRQRLPVAWRRMPELVPAAFVAAMIVVALGWNAWVGIRWDLDLTAYFAACGLALTFAAGMAGVAPVVAEIAFYLALWLLLQVFGTRLTYLCMALGHGLMDAALAEADAALGFDWVGWSRFVGSHALLDRALGFAYGSNFWQPAAAVVVSAVWRPRRRNAELFIALSVALVLTLAAGTLVPAIGPGDALGVAVEPAPVIRALLADPGGEVLPYVGIVSFPSFHTVLAVLFLYAHWGVRWTLPLALPLNLLMLVSVPLNGDHYLVDVLAGGVVAVTGIVVARWVGGLGRGW